VSRPATWARRGWSAVRRNLARPPRAAYWCALVAVLNALAWSIITPPFEVPDENGHYAYVQQLVEAGSLPRALPVFKGLSPREDAILEVIHAYRLPGAGTNPAPLTSADQRLLTQVENQPLSARGTGDALSESDNPPLYYLLEAVPYALSPSGSVLDRLALMRALSALFAGFTVFFVFMFLRELFPGTRWVWSMGALAVAFQPLFAFISGGVNNDSLLYAFAAALFFTIARVFRRGLDERTGLAVGAALGIGLLAKFTLLGFAPGAALAILYGLRRAWPTARRAALRGAAIAAALAAIPSLLYLKLFARVVTPGGIGTPATSVTGVHTSLRAEIAFVWQMFLPRLPWQQTHFTRSELWHEWFMGLIGRFGWLDTNFPFWVYLVAAPIAIALILAALAALVREHDRVWKHAAELTVYLVMIAGLCIEIGVESYRTLVTTDSIFEQPRYLLSGLCIYAAIVALASRLPGRRWGVAVGTLIVMLAFAHDLISQMLVIGRYYA
jgi:4-amino-4-deoxy-L-arabinose transferase-like glycosyltransferase